MLLSKYRLKNRKIYWHKLYFDIVPDWMTRYAPPGGFYNYAAYSYKPHEYVKDLWLQMKWFIQRGQRGYSDCDAWNLYSYIADIMPGALKQLIKGHSYPAGMTHKKWNTKLQAIREGFVAVKVLDNGRPDKKEYKQLTRTMNHGLKVFSENFLSLWD